MDDPSSTILPLPSSPISDSDPCGLADPSSGPHAPSLTPIANDGRIPHSPCLPADGRPNTPVAMSAEPLDPSHGPSAVARLESVSPAPHPRRPAAAAEPRTRQQANAQLSAHLAQLRTEMLARAASLAQAQSQFTQTLSDSPSEVQSIVDTILTLEDLATEDGPAVERHLSTPGFCLVPAAAPGRPLDTLYFLPMFSAPPISRDSSWWTRARALLANGVTLTLVTLGMLVEFLLPGMQNKAYYEALRLANVGRRIKAQQADVAKAKAVLTLGEAVVAGGAVESSARARV